MRLDEESYEVVLVIGNGFDLNLGLKTSYSDFIKSDQFKELIITENELCKYLKNKSQLQNWIDIENELRTYSQNHSDFNFYNEFNELSDALCRYLSNIDFPDLNKNMTTVKTIEKLRDKTALVIDFNYTDTFSRIAKFLNIQYNEDFEDIKHIKIHGSIEKNDIIIGVEDGAKIYNRHIFLKKSVNESFQALDFSRVILNSDIFIIFGHSLGITDHMYFKTYFTKMTTQEDQQMLVYHYGKDSYYKIYAQIDKLTSNRISNFKLNNTVYFLDMKKN